MWLEFIPRDLVSSPTTSGTTMTPSQLTGQGLNLSLIGLLELWELKMSRACPWTSRPQPHSQSASDTCSCRGELPASRVGRGRRSAYLPSSTVRTRAKRLFGCVLDHMIGRSWTRSTLRHQDKRKKSERLPGFSGVAAGSLGQFPVLEAPAFSGQVRVCILSPPRNCRGSLRPSDCVCAMDCRSVDLH